MNRIQHYIVYYSNVAFPPIPKLGFLSLDKAERYVAVKNLLNMLMGGIKYEQ